MGPILKGLLIGLSIIGTIVASERTHAQSQTVQRLAEVEFEVPEGWTATSRRGDRAIILAGRSGEELRVEWWFADEPFLGYADIVSHKRITVAGKRATWRHSSFPDRQIIAALLDEKRKDRRQLLIVLEVPGRDAAAAIRRFDDILSRFRYGAPAKGTMAPPQAPAAALPPRAPALSPMMQAAAASFGGACEAVDLAAWNHPSVAAIRSRKQARLEWAMLCRNRTLPVFGVELDYDPQGRTGSFFMPLYDDVLRASGGKSFAFVSIKDKLIIDVTQAGKAGMSVDYREASDLPEPTANGAAQPPAGQGSKAEAIGARDAGDDDVRLFLARASFSPPVEWELRANTGDNTIRFVRPDRAAEIIVMLWPETRPLPSENIGQLEHVIVADAPATRYRQKLAGGMAEHVVFEESYADGSRIAVTYRVRGESIEDGLAIFDLFLMDLKLNDSPPGGWTAGAPHDRQGDPFAGLDMSAFEKRR